MQSNNTKIPWPTRPSALAKLGVLGRDAEVLPDCDNCKIVVTCQGYSPINPFIPVPPCRSYETYTDYLEQKGDVHATRNK